MKRGQVQRHYESVHWLSFDWLDRTNDDAEKFDGNASGIIACMDPVDRLNAAVHALIALRRDRLASLGATRDLELDVLALEFEAQKFALLNPAERAAIGEAWAQLEAAFGGATAVLDQYPDAAGLLMTLRIPGARSSLLGLARLTTARPGA